MKGVVYLLYGRKHPLQLVISLYSLRHFYDGPVTVLCGHDNNNDTAVKAGVMIAADDRLNADAQPFQFIRSGRKNNGYANKTLLQSLSPYDSTVFLDADTLIVQPFPEVWPEDDEAVLTNFADWRSKGIRIRGRCEKWRHVCPDHVDRMVNNDYPAINTGVMGFTKRTKFMTPWREMTLKNISFICDEIAAQLIFPDFDHRILDHRFNASVVYSAGKKLVPDVRIWHGHGSKFFRKHEGRTLWCPWYQAALHHNIAGIQTWTPFDKDDDFTRNKTCTI